MAPLRPRLIPLFVLALPLPRALHAATLTVDDSGGAGYTRIQSAVDAAHDGDTILVRAGTYAETVEVDGLRLIITGAGSGAVLVRGDSSGSALTIDGGATVTLSGLELTGGQRGLTVRQSTVTASGLLIDANSTAGSGGGVGVFEGGSLVLSDSEVSGNEAGTVYHGGGLYVDASSLTLTRCDVAGNDADQGGGLYAEGSDIEIVDSTFEDNEARSHGGGLRLRGGSTLVASGSTVTSNTSGGRGGGAAFEDSDGTWSACTVSDNVSASGGGGLYLSGQLSGGSTFDGDLTGNTSGGAGGAIWAWSHALTLGGNVEDNACPSTEDGGAIYFGAAALTLDAATITGHHAASGGAVYVTSAGTLSISSSTLTENVADELGGAVYTGAGATIRGAFLDRNEAGSEGGALYSEAGRVTLSGSRMQANVAGGAGGGMSLHAGSLSITSSGLRDNTSAQGGGVCLAGGGVAGLAAVVAYSAFTDNSAEGAGGGLYLDSLASAQVYETELSGNSSGGRGGGLYVLQVPALQAYALDVHGNEALEGGGLYLASVGGSAWGLELAGNAAFGAGGGAVLATPAAAFTVRNSRVWENSASQGGGLYLATDPAGLFTILNADIAANTGGGLWLASAAGSGVVNTIVASNTGVGLGSDDADHTGALAYDLVWGNGTDWGGVLASRAGQDGNLSADPRYTALLANGDPGDDSLLLGSLSPARDAGDPTLFDLDGSRSDMGSYGGAGAEDGDDDGDGVARSAGDCDDGQAGVHPGATEVIYNGMDDDCDPATADDDLDGDGYGIATDCDDDDASIHPGAEDTPDDGIDQDCDGADGEAPDDTGDTGDTGGVPPNDRDGDGYPPPEDCNDLEPDANPGMAESCDDGIDNDCDGYVDASDGDCGGHEASCSGCAQGGRGAAGAAALLLGLIGLAWRRPTAR
ncbi:MAG: right-handed parallel beta-helix repeat-containing protein [Pseudomonadota bacterium]